MPATNPIGMSVPGASSLMMSPADDVAAETEQQRKKRLLAMQNARQLPVGISDLDGYGAALSMR